jgi:hypothetical protein
MYYLIGLIIERSGEAVERQYWADSNQEESVIWAQLLDELMSCGESTGFHYGSYEREFIERMAERYGPGGIGSSIITKLIDVHALIRTNVFFPVFSLGLKDVAGHLGATWNGPIHSGLDRIAWRTRWERNHQTTLKQDLLAYNLDDCRALKRVADFLERISNGTADEQHGAMRIDQAPKRSFGGFGESRFAIPDLATFTKCAYFDYQRDKVLIRTEANVRITAKRKQRISRRKLRINQRIECSAPEVCPRCKLVSIRANRGSKQSKVRKDLRFSATGVRRWVVEYTSQRYMH